MVFSDLLFLFCFLPSFALCYLLAGWIDRRFPNAALPATNRAKNAVLVLFSLIFYAWGEPVYVFLMLLSVLINFFVGLRVEKHLEERKKAKVWLTVGVAVNLLLLGTFKYLGFFGQLLADCGLPVGVPHLALPIGISFYTFQSISYLVDVYRRESPAQHRFRDLLLYISMFPQLIAGPIVRYGTIASEINGRRVSAADFADGAYRFFIGLGKKVIIANQMALIADQFLVNGLKDLTMWGAWIGILAFALQIYFDFSGYSDMAIGMGRAMGFHFKENFNHPYCCNSVSNFWRRWHISLGSFFRDYVYIPMGGNRRHQALNIFVVWALTGFWHGASWNFLIWGLYFGFFVAFEKYTILKLKNPLWQPLFHVYSLLVVLIGWGIFYFEDFGKMRHFFHAFFGGTQRGFDVVVQTAFTDNFFLWIAAVVLCLPVRSFACRRLGLSTFAQTTAGSYVRSIAHVAISAALLVLSVSLLVGATNNPFIYTRF